MPLIDIPSLLQAAFINAISGIVANIFWIILIIFIYRGLKKQIKQTGHEIIKNIPKWIQDYNKMMISERTIENARKSMEIIKQG